ncbi:Vacuolar protein-sorting-associated protein 36, partial [Blyttiomyces sp. JEL0837]
MMGVVVEMVLLIVESQSGDNTVYHRLAEALMDLMDDNDGLIRKVTKHNTGKIFDSGLVNEKEPLPYCMDLFTKGIALTSGRRPVLEQGESVLLTQRDVGLYEGNTRLQEYDAGIAYITTHRLIWVDDKRDTSVALSLALIHSISNTGGFSLPTGGFIKSSPKIILTLRKPTTASASTSSTSSTTPSSTQPQQQQTINPWICQICDSVNVTTLSVCDHCGVKRQNMPEPTPQQQPQQQSNRKEKICTVCTFSNHPDLQFCEMCDSPLGSQSQSQKGGTSGTGTISGSTSTSSSLNELSMAGGKPVTLATPLDSEVSVVKLSFRTGGLGDFLKVLKGALADKEWEKIVASKAVEVKKVEEDLAKMRMGGITQRIEQANKLNDTNLNEAFRDLDALMTKAADMVKLAESITSRLNSSGNAAALTNSDSPDIVAFRSYLVELGISSPVTKETTGDSYSQELAKELADFLDKVMVRYGGMIALTDLYCIFNRARGVVVNCLRDCDSCIDYGNSTADYCDDAIATRIMEHVTKAVNDGVTAVDIAKADKISMVLAREQLL